MVTRRSGSGKGAEGRVAAPGAAASPNTKARGDAAEDRALVWLQAQGLKLVQRNYRVAFGPSARGGEIDLVMRDRDGTLVFVEVRARSGTGHGGAAASVTRGKQQRVIRAAQHYLLRLATLPPCRFDVVAVQDGQIDWVRGAFDAA